MIETFQSVWTSQDLGAKTIQHLEMFFWALLLSILFGILIGILIYKKKQLADIVFHLLNTIELIPTLALLILLLPLLGLGSGPTIAACILYSLLPIARNTYTGLISVNKEYLQAAQGIGLSSKEILLNIRIPYALPHIIGGIRIAIVFTMGVVTLGGVIAAGGLGQSIQTGLQFNKPDIIIVSSIWVGILAVIFDLFAGMLERALIRRNHLG